VQHVKRACFERARVPGPQGFRLRVHYPPMQRGFPPARRP
jgi:hypothetical protein